jgi:hypothetical protein
MKLKLTIFFLTEDEYLTGIKKYFLLSVFLLFLKLIILLFFSYSCIKITDILFLFLKKIGYKFLHEKPCLLYKKYIIYYKF